MPQTLHKLVGYRVSPTAGRVSLIKLHFTGPEPVRDAQGNVFEAATLIKAAHQAGGQPLMKRSTR